MSPNEEKMCISTGENFFWEISEKNNVRERWVRYFLGRDVKGLDWMDRHSRASLNSGESK